MENNSVHLVGTVKRDAKAGSGVLDFALVINGDIFDCRLTSQSEAYAQLEGFVNEGETIELMGHLGKRTQTDAQRLAGVWVEVRQTSTFVFVDHIIESED